MSKAELRELAEELLIDELTIDVVEDLSVVNQTYMIKVSSNEDCIIANAFGGMVLDKFMQEGFICRSVAGGDNYRKAWFTKTNVSISI